MFGLRPVACTIIGALTRRITVQLRTLYVMEYPLALPNDGSSSDVLKLQSFLTVHRVSACGPTSTCSVFVAGKDSRFRFYFEFFIAPTKADCTP